MKFIKRFFKGLFITAITSSPILLVYSGILALTNVSRLSGWESFMVAVSGIILILISIIIIFVNGFIVDENKGEKDEKRSDDM